MKEAKKKSEWSEKKEKEVKKGNEGSKWEWGEKRK